MDGKLVLELKAKAESELRGVQSLKPEEAAVLALLRTRLADRVEQLDGSSVSSSSRKQRARAAQAI